MTIHHGKLVRQGNGRFAIASEDGKILTLRLPELSAELGLVKSGDSRFDGVAVDFDRDGEKGEPKNIREAGKPHVVSAPPPVAAGPVRVPGRGYAAKAGFHNPYSFIPALPRAGLDGSPLGDAKPCGHDRLLKEHWSGWIDVKLTTKTPLLMLDAARAKANPTVTGHACYATRTDPEGKPYLAPTSIRGALRSAYEAITNSRFGVYDSAHKHPLSYRPGHPRVREYYRFSPAALLDDSLKPATSIDKLSPADRVFGWVNPEGDGAYRGQLRIGPVHCEAERKDALVEFEKPVPLAILGQPRPASGRFYVAEDRTGTAQKARKTKESAGYSDQGKGLRGRKVYPHHSWIDRPELANYWTPEAEQPGAGPTFVREYLRTANRLDGQNRSIKDWIAPGTTFNFRVHVENLSAVELGALLWLLPSGGKKYLRLGGGKPLGFGSVGLEAVEVDLATGAAWANRFRNFSRTFSPTDPGAAQGEGEIIGSLKLRSPPSAGVAGVAGLVDGFVDEAKRCFKDHQNRPLLDYATRAATGFGDALPVHYPRSAAIRDPEGKNFTWFVANDARGGPGLTLPGLLDDKELPYQ